MPKILPPDWLNAPLPRSVGFFIFSKTTSYSSNFVFQHTGGVARIFQSGCNSVKQRVLIRLWHFCHQNIVGCFLKKAYKGGGGSRAPPPFPPCYALYIFAPCCIRKNAIKYQELGTPKGEFWRDKKRKRFFS